MVQFLSRLSYSTDVIFGCISWTCHCR